MTPLKFVGRTCCRYVISFALNKFDEHRFVSVSRSRMPCAILVTGEEDPSCVFHEMKS